MRQRLSVLLIAIVTLVSSTLSASGDVNTSRSVSFGDSLTHNDLLPFVFMNDPAIYGADPFEAAFHKAAYRDDQLLNFAVLGSTSADVLTQVDEYTALRKDGVLQPATLFSLQAGGNDILDNIAVLASAPPGTNWEVDKVTLGIKWNIIESLLKLRRTDRRADVVLWTVPDITQIPLVLAMGLPEAAQSNVRRHIETINRCIRLLGHTRHVAVLDIYEILRETVANPPVLAGMTLIAPPAFGGFDNIFADPIHPTAVSNAILANGIITAMNRKFHDDIPLYSEAELTILAFPSLVW